MFIHDKTRKHLEWFEENINKYKYRNDFRKAFAKEFGIGEKQWYRIKDIYIGKKDNTSEWRNHVVNSEKKMSKNKGNACLFCRSTENLIEHHPSYLTADTNTLCSSCHQKIHRILKKSHDEQVALYLNLVELKKNAKILIECINNITTVDIPENDKR